MDQYFSQLIILAKLYFFNRFAYSDTTLPSDFYQPGPGVFLGIWTSNVKFNLNTFSQIPEFPSCPNYVLNLNSFKYNAPHRRSYQYGAFKTAFVSRQTGLHKFFAVADDQARVSIQLYPPRYQVILEFTKYTAESWDHRKWANEVFLLKGVQYKIDALWIGEGFPDFFSLGVQFPDGSEVKPIDDVYAHRSMAFYKWNGVLTHYYDNFQFPSSRPDYTLPNVYKLNPSYPSGPTSYRCKSTVYDTADSHYETYGLKYIGYVSFTAAGNYMLRMSCKKLCEFNMTIISGVVRRLEEYSYQQHTVDHIMTAGLLSKDARYPITIFLTDQTGKDFFRLSWKRSEDIYYQSTWNGMIHNLASVETDENVTQPVVEAINSTAIGVYLPSVPFLPPRDNWTYAAQQEVIYYRTGYIAEEQAVTVIGAPPRTIPVTNLLYNTEYTIYLRYFGTVRGAVHKINTNSVTAKTREEYPRAPPSSFKIYMENATAARLMWNEIPVQHRKGMVEEYMIRYKETCQADSCLAWKYQMAKGLSIIIGHLRANKMYQFQICGVIKLNTRCGPWSYTLIMSTTYAHKYSAESLGQFATNIGFTDKALTGHVCQITEVDSVEECFRLCLKTYDIESDCKCYSINISGMRNGGKGVCEINGGNHEVFSFDLIDRKSYQYYNVY